MGATEGWIGINLKWHWMTSHLNHPRHVDRNGNDRVIEIVLNPNDDGITFAWEKRIRGILQRNGDVPAAAVSASVSGGNSLEVVVVGAVVGMKKNKFIICNFLQGSDGCKRSSRSGWGLALLFCIVRPTASWGGGGGGRGKSLVCRRYEIVCSLENPRCVGIYVFNCVRNGLQIGWPLTSINGLAANNRKRSYKSTGNNRNFNCDFIPFLWFFWTELIYSGRKHSPIGIVNLD